MKNTYVINNNVGGFDLMTEKDSGNPVRILTGSKKYSLDFWESIKNLADSVIDTIESGETDEISRIDVFKPKLISDREERKNKTQGIFKH